MAIRALRDLTSSVAKVADELGRMNNELDKAANTRFTSLPASFTPLPPSPPGTPTNPLPPTPFPTPIPTLFGPNNRPISSSSPTTSSSSEGGGGDRTFLRAEGALIPTIPPGGPLRTRVELNGLVSVGYCEIMVLPSGSEVISCPDGMYPGENGILSSVSASSSTGAGSSSSSGDTGSGTGGLGLDRTGNQDRTRRFNPNVTNNPTGRQFGSSTAAASTVNIQLDSKPITDRLDGLRQDIRDLSRGDGGASIRLRNGV